MKNSDEFVFAVTKESEYYFSKIDKNKVNLAFTFKKNNFIIKLFRKINLFFIKFFPNLTLVKYINKKICYKAYDKKIVNNIVNNCGLAILDSYVKSDLLFLIKTFNADKCFFLIWNALSDDKINLYLKYLNKNNIYSYSLIDCNKYGLNYFNDFYLMDYPVKNLPIKFDFYFLGQDKGRIVLLSNFAELIEKENYKYKFDIYSLNSSDLKNKYPYFTFFSKYFPFDKYLDNVFSSICLVDFNSTSNITFRTLEAMIFNKKYITNNVSIKQYDFYDENNILIVDDETNIYDIIDFMNKPIKEISDDCKRNYDFYTIYSIFKEKCNLSDK